MSLHTVVGIFVTALFAVAPAVTSAGMCVDRNDGPSGTDLCRQSAEPGVVAVVLPGDQWNDHFPVAAEFPRQIMTVWFHKPIKVGDRILFGKYIIEHDNVRMSRGQPCTHLYDASDPRLPVVAFHCRHLTRPATDRPMVMVRSFGEANGMTELLAFQFAGETAAHGVPTAR